MRASLAPRLVSASLATRFATASKHGTSLSAASRHAVSDEAWNIWDALGMPRPEPGSVNVLARSADDSRPAAVKARAPLRPLDSGPVLVLFENDRVRVADFRLPPGGSFHTSHEYATVRWQVEEGQHALNGASCESVRDKQVFFLEPGESWEIRNTGDTVYRQITFELKRPPRRTEAEVAALLRSAIYSTDVGTELLLENRWCRDVHHHVLDYVFVFAYPGRLLLSNHDGSPGLADSINGENDVTWNEIPDGAASIPTFAHGGRNGLDDRPMREYLVELK
ncbi:hypothetical protein EMIHUDRAFT_247554 [Emiliania huxleyi CCMP1516]|uniref:Cupin 2 conserved barrel domain-containing protein n=2 Tax=Emiliania huxleyi TaxID=2903 RepID=A0A0D3ILV6_EMIH1|nr:hypothetical protein EMIHUDRAFT_247554 [Emiliania huxleyi CCMP1516]EOD12241.1 hypothetical protein EMIHUDRAFT_247554 [Emiliania huxleyi CCMP1516]|eukprot:XP_005764670.1 hypothetical protein EMIHUDRAFT_247554 [Emiliania huxleyi CCMP1516]